jgi:hypothetical protein
MKSAIVDRGFLLWVSLSLLSHGAAVLLATAESDSFVYFIISGFVFLTFSVHRADCFYKAQKTSA